MENWKPVFGYEGRYEVSDLANVRSLERIKLTRIGLQRWPAKNLKPFLDSNGYFYVNLCNGNSAKKTSLHHIVLEAFHGKRPLGLIGLHNDGNSKNCLPSNLRWGTYSENSNDSKIHGTFRYGSPLLNLELVEWIKESSQNSICIGKILGVASSTIRAVRIGQNWSR